MRLLRRGGPAGFTPRTRAPAGAPGRVIPAIDRTLRNPILPGIHPDPSPIREGGSYFLATSTSGWWPGVAPFRSENLADWRPIGHAVTRPGQLNLRGIGDSRGLWAPSLSHDGERFFLTVCCVRSRSVPSKDMRVLRFTADAAAGPWSDPVRLGGSGFDPSLFHDPDTGRKSLLDPQWDFRPDEPGFGGIVAQEFAPPRGR